METIVLVSLFFIIVIGGIFLARRRQKTRFPKGVYKPSYILTRNEYSFYQKLVKELGGDYLLCPKVRLEDVIGVSNTVINEKQRQMYRGYVKSRHVDFIVCDKKLHVLCGIELDDSSHFSEDAKRSDAIKNEIFSCAGVKLLRGYNNDEDLKKIVREVKKL